MSLMFFANAGCAPTTPIISRQGARPSSRRRGSRESHRCISFASRSMTIWHGLVTVTRLPWKLACLFDHGARRDARDILGQTRTTRSDFQDCYSCSTTASTCWAVRRARRDRHAGGLGAPALHPPRRDALAPELAAVRLEGLTGGAAGRGQLQSGERLVQQAHGGGRLRPVLHFSERRIRTRLCLCVLEKPAVSCKLGVGACGKVETARPSFPALHLRAARCPQAGD